MSLTLDSPALVPTAKRDRYVVMDVLYDGTCQRVLRCTFPPTFGHERHYHDRHFGYVIAGGRMQITDSTGTRVVEPAPALTSEATASVGTRSSTSAPPLPPT